MKIFINHFFLIALLMAVAPECLGLQQVDSKVRIYRNSEEKETRNLEITPRDDSRGF